MAIAAKGVLHCCCFLIQFMTSYAILRLEVRPETGENVVISCDQQRFFNMTIEQLIIQKPENIGRGPNDCYCLLYQGSGCEWPTDQPVSLWYKDEGSLSVEWRMFERDDAVNSEPRTIEGIKFRYEYTGAGDPMLVISHEDGTNKRSIPQGRVYRFTPENYSFNLHLSCNPIDYFDPRLGANPTTIIRCRHTTSSNTTAATTVRTSTSTPATMTTPTAVTTPTTLTTHTSVTTPTAARTTPTETRTTKTITTAADIPTTRQQIKFDQKSTTAAWSSSGGASSDRTDTFTVVIIVLVFVVAALVASILINVIRRRSNAGASISNFYMKAGPVEDNSILGTSYTGLQLTTPQTGEYMKITEIARGSANDAVTEKDNQYVNVGEMMTDYENVDVSDVIKNVDVSDGIKEKHLCNTATYENTRL